MSGIILRYKKNTVTHNFFMILEQYEGRKIQVEPVQRSLKCNKSLNRKIYNSY